MNKLFGLIAVLLISVAVAQQPTPQPIEPFTPKQDVEFHSLGAWSQDIDQQTDKWNDQCGKIAPPDEACLLVKARIDAQQKAWIVAAKTYKLTGEDCQGKAKYDLIQEVIALYTWNITCAGLPPTPQCLTDSTRIEDTKQKVHDEIAACLGGTI